MRGVASIRTETHLRRFLHGIRLFCNAHSPPKALSPQNLFLSQKHAPIFQSTLLPLAIRALHRPISLRLIRAFAPYFAALNTGSCYAIAPTRGQCAPPLRLCARRSAACAHTPTQPARIAVGNTGFHRPISLRLIRAFVALFRCAQYGLLLRYCPHSGAMRSAATAMCSPLRRLRAYAYATRPYCRWQYGLPSPYFAALNTGFCRPISLRSIRALATLLPPLGGNALRRYGYVLAAPPLARIRLRNPPVLPLAIRDKVTQFIQSTSR